MSTSILTVLCTTRFTNTIRQLLKILLAKLGEANVPHIAIVINHHEHSPEAKQKRAKIHKMEEQQYQASCRAMLGSAIQGTVHKHYAVEQPAELVNNCQLPLTGFKVSCRGG